MRLRVMFALGGAMMALGVAGCSQKQKAENKTLPSSEGLKMQKMPANAQMTPPHDPKK